MNKLKILKFNLINNVTEFSFEFEKINKLVLEIEISQNKILEKFQAINFSIVIEDNITKLNKNYRNKDKDTNVLSFHNYNLLTENITEKEIDLGDIIISYQQIRIEVKEQNKKLENHLLHLITHGILHLIGYDHIKDDEAEIMEELEKKNLEKINIIL